MDQASSDTLPSLFPYFGYWNAAVALDWLADAFGLETTVEPVPLDPLYAWHYDVDC